VKVKGLRLGIPRASRVHHQARIHSSQPLRECKTAQSAILLHSVEVCELLRSTKTNNGTGKKIKLDLYSVQVIREELLEHEMRQRPEVVSGGGQRVRR